MSNGWEGAVANRAVRGLGEVALRVADLDAMRAFYSTVIGLEVLGVFDHAVFFKIAEGYGGHTQVLALFDRSGDTGYPGIDGKLTTLDHFAFAIDLNDYESEKQRLEQLGCRVTTAEHAWVGWRSLYVRDPEGNVVELVCFDERARKV
jgi:catechol 2,3-dioxygenase